MEGGGPRWASCHQLKDLSSVLLPRLADCVRWHCQSDSISLLINKSLVWQIENGEIREALFSVWKKWSNQGAEGKTYPHLLLRIIKFLEHFSGAVSRRTKFLKVNEPHPIAPKGSIKLNYFFYFCWCFLRFGPTTCLGRGTATGQFPGRNDVQFRRSRWFAFIARCTLNLNERLSNVFFYRLVFMWLPATWWPLNVKFPCKTK